MRESGATSAYRKFNELRQFYNWVDALPYKVNFGSAESMQAAYVNYTAYLLQLVNISNINAKRINRETASSYQRMAANVVAAASGLSVHQVYALATKFRKLKRIPGGMSVLTSQEEQSRTFAALVNFIDEVHRVVVLNGEFPILFSSPNDQDFIILCLLKLGPRARILIMFIRICGNLINFLLQRCSIKSQVIHLTPK